eukprot:TRINITY_DN9723_c0_g1_i1.p1 TRINITY_DN9723_c0_g1~~TRINITY_DN9723_c0_g1_i1.p1  ORF type:complete len:362 (+),score=98.09 TRINITY_DN9723_c0_g1_i1:61-1146(+)
MSLLDTLFDVMLDNGNTFNTLLLLLEVDANRRGYTGETFSYVDALLEAKRRRVAGGNGVVFDEPTTAHPLRSAKAEMRFKQDVEQLQSRIQQVREQADSPRNEAANAALVAEYRDEVGVLLATETDGHPYLKMFLKGLRHEESGVRETKASRLRQQRWQHKDEEEEAEEGGDSTQRRQSPSRDSVQLTPRAPSPSAVSSTRYEATPSADNGAVGCWTQSKHSILRGETVKRKKTRKTERGAGYGMYMKKTAWADRATAATQAAPCAARQPVPVVPRLATAKASSSQRSRSPSQRSPSPRTASPPPYRHISNTPGPSLYQPRAQRKSPESFAREMKQKAALVHHPQNLRSLPRPPPMSQNRA